MTSGDHPRGTPQPSGKRSIFERPGVGRTILIGLAVMCAASFGLDAYDKHGHFEYESWFGFHAFAGFLAYSFIVFSAKLLRRIVKRPEDYYD